MPTRNAELMRSLGKATAAYEAHIELAADYLAERRIEMSTARSLRLGYVAEPEAGHEWFTGRLAIPYLTRAGVVQVKFRSLDGSDPKYLGIDGVRPHLYNVESLFMDSPVIAVTEGELDAAILAYQCDVPAVGCPGVAVWQDHFPRLFAGYDRVAVFADGDAPGREFAQRVALDLEQANVVRLPDGTDVNDIYITEGAVALRRRAGLD